MPNCCPKPKPRSRVELVSALPVRPDAVLATIRNTGWAVIYLLVFGAGTVQWSWGLDNGAGSGNSGGPVDPTMQQATVNLFADMGNVQPATLMNGLTPATQTTDTSPPTATITSPSQGATFSDGTAVTISGTATDAGGGVFTVDPMTALREE